MTWDPFGTLGNALWIGGGQWAGKSTVANLLAHRHGLTAYHYDYADARGREDRRIARAVRAGTTFARDFEAMFVTGPPERMAADVLADFAAGFEWVLDDLRALVSGRPILAEGYGLRPELVVPAVAPPGRMVVMVPTPEFQLRQARELPRAGAISAPTSDPERAQRNRLARDRLLAQDAARSARALGVPVIEVDGERSVEQIADEVAKLFGPWLPALDGP
ncbi:hypothetical protein ACFFWC_18470 [Plantactinospora siamensis]|uniref:Shikimate kinase n=1 Tax=Plantactinospora siamensis TaxID=555372 RepID=A0ABV6NQ13_9ACTN